MEIARLIMAAGTLDLGWGVIRDHSEEFLCTDDEEPESRWNELARRTCTAAAPEIGWNGNRPELILAGRTLPVPLVFDRDDTFIKIHSIAQIGADILEIRFCHASAHSSDQAYLAGTPGDWLKLEQEFGAAEVATQFLPIPSDVKDFAKLLYAPFAPPQWARSLGGRRHFPVIE
jgi:hypothetical protein